MSAADFPNTGTIYDYFLARLTAAGGANPQAEAAGITGNLLQESGGNPESRGSGGAGLAGWTIGGRWQAGLATGNQQTDLQNQLDYVWQELTTTPAYGLSSLEQQTTALGAAQTFGADYERFGIAGNRFNYAQQVYAEATAPTNTATLDISGKQIGSALGSGIGNVLGPVGSTLGGDAGAAVGSGGILNVSQDISDVESWLLRMGIALVGVVLIIAALVLAGHSSDLDGEAAPSGPSQPLGPLEEAASPEAAPVDWSEQDLDRIHRRGLGSR